MPEYIERENLAKEGWFLQRHVYGDGYAAIETKKNNRHPRRGCAACGAGEVGMETKFYRVVRTSRRKADGT